ncbi:hypothetical protein D9M68_941970 [compost metagenome]
MDANVSYQVNDHLILSLEGINLTDETQRVHENSSGFDLRSLKAVDDHARDMDRPLRRRNSKECALMRSVPHKARQDPVVFCHLLFNIPAHIGKRQSQRNQRFLEAGKARTLPW